MGTIRAVEPGVVIITGCSTGIGRATATALAAAGYTVVATARRPEAIDGLGAALALPLDVTDDDSIQAALGASLERFGRIDALVDSSGGTQIVAVAADGTDSRPIADGVSGFWNP